MLGSSSSCFLLLEVSDWNAGILWHSNFESDHCCAISYQLGLEVRRLSRNLSQITGLLWNAFYLNYVNKPNLGINTIAIVGVFGENPVLGFKYLSSLRRLPRYIFLTSELVDK